MKKILLSLIFLSAMASYSQTNVSGAIFSNTTWTKANSPYIVTDTVVVFPGVTLTIEPGVTVKFDDYKGIELRESQFIALGTATDSITFTSNSPTPTVGSYWGIVRTVGLLVPQINYCNFLYAGYGLYAHGDTSPIIIKHCRAAYNGNGLSVTRAIVDSCYFNNNGDNGISMNIGSVSNSFFIDNNNYGLFGNAGDENDTGLIYNCIFKGNGMGLFAYTYVKVFKCIAENNGTGMRMEFSHVNIDSCIINNNRTGIILFEMDHILQNSIIDSNTEVGVRLGWETFEEYGHTVINCEIKHNGIGIIDTISRGSLVSENDIEDNNIGIALYSPFDTVTCNRICNNTIYNLKYGNPAPVNIAHNYWCEPDSASTKAGIYDALNNVHFGIATFMPIDSLCTASIPTLTHEISNGNSFRIFPNPFSSTATIQSDHLLRNAALTVNNSLGQIVKQIKNISGQTITLFRDNLPSGLYFLRITEDGNLFTCKLMVTDN